MIKRLRQERRRVKRYSELLTDEMKRVVEKQRLGFVATVCADGTPNLSPKGTLRVLDDHHLMFADIRSPGTVANLRTNPGIEVNVVDPFVRKGYRFKGRAEVLDAGPEFDRLAALYSTPELSDAPRRIRAMVIVRVEETRPLISPAYDRETDEAAMRARWTQYYLDAENRSSR
jgi:predicted pyridoxine 5'-phosphate oxidase superfamily flavin-nucleotide-binding protein